MLTQSKHRGGKRPVKTRRAPAPSAQIKPLSDRRFALFQQLISKETGIWLAPTKRQLLVGRLTKRLRALGMKGFDEYYALVTTGGDAEETVRMIDCICTNETQFFRERRHYEALEDHILPMYERMAREGRRDKRIKVWSSACSTGEEPYSLAMLLLDRYGADPDWRIDVLATDLSTRVVEQARSGVWALQRSQNIPDKMLKRFMLRGRDESSGLMKATDELRRRVSVRRLNLIAPTYDVAGQFDLLFCSNVLMYFDPTTRARVVERLVERLAPSGYFFVGHAESLHRTTPKLKAIFPTVYAHSSALLEGLV